MLPETVEEAEILRKSTGIGFLASKSTAILIKKDSKYRQVVRILSL